MKIKSGIYKIENVNSKKVYVGQSRDLEKRKINHFSELKNNIHGNPHLQNSFNKEGKENFVFSILLYCENFELTKYEKFFDSYYKQAKGSYNIRECVDSNKNLKCSEETKKKISFANRGKKFTLGYKMSEETKAKISIANKGRKPLLGYKFSEESKEKMSKSHIGKGLGRTHTEETKKKISEAHMGKKATDTAKENISNGLKLLWKKRKEVTNVY